MKKYSIIVIVVVILPFIVALSSPAHAAIYYASAITAINVNSDGWMSLRWEGLPNPGPCGGNNNNWVMIRPTASETLKALVLSLYFSGKPARIDTYDTTSDKTSCNGPYETVYVIYSPGG
jgi:hypothetical protein